MVFPGRDGKYRKLDKVKSHVSSVHSEWSSSRVRLPCHVPFGPQWVRLEFDIVRLQWD